MQTCVHEQPDPRHGYIRCKADETVRPRSFCQLFCTNPDKPAFDTKLTVNGQPIIEGVTRRDDTWIKPGTVGDVLARFIKWLFGVDSRESCGCRAMQKWMNAIGKRTCWRMRGRILTKLRQEAQRKAILYIHPGAVMLVMLAILFGRDAERYDPQ